MSQIELIGDHTKVTVNCLEMYSDNTPMLRLGEIPKGAVDTMVVRPTSLHNFVTAMFLADSLEWQGRKISNLVLPYVPGARQDRINSDGDVLWTNRSVAKLINDRYFNKVVTLDVHSDVTSYFINNCEEYPLEEMYSRLWPGYGGVIAPDEGAVQRAGTAAKVMELPLIQATKHRDPSNGKLSGFGVEVESGFHYLVVDDICDGGGTFIGLGEKIREQGAFADLFVTHGIFSKGTETLKKYYKNIYTTDSMENTDRTLRIPVVERMIQWTR